MTPTRSYVMWLDDGVCIRGPLCVREGLVLIGDEYLDDALRRRWSLTDAARLEVCCVVTRQGYEPLTWCGTLAVYSEARGARVFIRDRDVAGLLLAAFPTATDGIEGVSIEVTTY